MNFNKLLLLSVATCAVAPQINAEDTFSQQVQETALTALAVGGLVTLGFCYYKTKCSYEERLQREARFLEIISWGNVNLLQEMINNGSVVSVDAAVVYDGLMSAIEKGYADIVRLLLSLEVDVNRVNDRGNFPLIIAAGNGHYDIVELLIEAGADVSQTTCRGIGSLEIAADKGYTPVVELLIQAGAEVDQADNDGITSLHCAVCADNGAVVEVLLEAGADIDPQDIWLWTPLMAATDKEFPDLVFYLLNNGANPLLINNKGLNAYDIAMIKNNSTIIEIYRSYSLYVRMQRLGEEAILAIEVDDIDALNTVIKEGLDVNTIINSLGFSFLMYAVNAGSYEAVQVLLQAGADIKTSNGPLIGAVIQQRLDLIQLLVEAGMDLNGTTSLGWTPVMVAAYNGDIDALSYLLDAGAEITAQQFERLKIYVDPTSDVFGLLAQTQLPKPTSNQTVLNQVDVLTDVPVDAANDVPVVAIS